VGAVRFLPAIVLTQIIVSAGLWWFIAASYGRYGAAIGTLVSVPIEVFISTLVVRYQVRFSYGELAGALRKSTVLLGLSAAGSAVTLTAAGWRADVSMETAVVAVILCSVGWLGGLRLTQHPLGQDVLGARHALLKSSVAAMVLARSMHEESTSL
jgi:hypothetical protein